MATSGNRAQRAEHLANLVDSYDKLTRHVKQGLQAQVEEHGVDPGQQLTAMPAMTQRTRSASYSPAPVMKDDDVRRMEPGAGSESSKRRTHARSASTSSSELLVQPSTTTRLVKRHSMRSTRSEEHIPQSSGNSPHYGQFPRQEGHKRGLRRRMKDHTRDWLERRSRKPEQSVTAAADQILLPGERAASLLKMLAPDDARALRLKLADLREELEASAAADKRKNHRLRDFLAGELNALNDGKISAALDQIPIGETLNRELDILRDELEKRGRFSRVDIRIDTDDRMIDSEINRLYTHHFFMQAPDSPSLPSSLQGLTALLPPLFLARMGETVLTLCMNNGRDEVLAMPKEYSGAPALQLQWKRSAASLLAKFVGPSANGLLLWTVGEHVGPAFHLFMMDLLFNREGGNGKPESELRRYDGKPIRPLGEACVTHRLERLDDGSIAIDYEAQMSSGHRGAASPWAELLEDAGQRFEVDANARLQVNARVIVRGSRDVEITDIFLRASGWNGG